MKNQTAVEYLHSEYKRILGDISIDVQKMFAISDSYQTALALEEEQLVDCGDTCAFRMRVLCDKIDKMTGEEIKVLAHKKTDTLGAEYYKEKYS